MRCGKTFDPGKGVPNPEAPRRKRRTLERVTQLRVDPIVIIETAEHALRRSAEDVYAHGQAPVLFERPGDFRPQQPVTAAEAVREKQPSFHIGCELDGVKQHAHPALVLAPQGVGIEIKVYALEKLQI